MDNVEQMVRLDPMARLGLMAYLGPTVHLDNLEILETLEIQVPKDNGEILEAQETPDQMEMLVRQDPMVKKVHLEFKVVWDLPVPLVKLDHKDHKEIEDPQV